MSVNKADIQWLALLVEQAQKREFYGKLTISFEKGVIQRAVKEESLKPPR